MSYGYGRLAHGYRLPETTRPGSVHLLVHDLARSLAYYQQVLGLSIATRTADRAALGCAGCPQPLVHLRAGATSGTARRAERLGLYHFALLVPDRPALGRFLTHLTQNRIPFASADHAVSEAVYLWDPDGLGIEVYVDRPRHMWRVDGDELFMTTEPLDVADVQGSAGDHPWSGMPPGTGVGHMHLHVGNLGEGEAFYHAALGFDKTVWSFPGALFLSAGGYHHHLGINTWAGRVPARRETEPGLLEWEIVVPAASDARAASASCHAVGYAVESAGDAWRVTDPWGTALLIVPADAVPAGAPRSEKA
jgi:catechol 2,3-dioxygenase